MITHIKTSNIRTIALINKNQSQCSNTEKSTLQNDTVRILFYIAPQYVT